MLLGVTQGLYQCSAADSSIYSYVVSMISVLKVMHSLGDLLATVARGLPYDMSKVLLALVRLRSPTSVRAHPHHQSTSLIYHL